MRSKLILIGGASGVGKTTLAERLNGAIGCPNIRMYTYVLRLARERGIDNPLQLWDTLLEESVPSFIEDVVKWGFATCDYHFAVQPLYDAAYALGRGLKEDLNEPYIRGLCDGCLQVNDWSRITLYSILLDAPTNHILERRKRLSDFKRPRSLDPRSIENERVYERKYFEESVRFLDKICRNILVVENSEGDFEGAFEKVLLHVTT